nr:tetraspanin [Hymenolepis microstoma]
MCCCFSTSPRCWRTAVLILTSLTFLLGLCILGIGLFFYFEHCGKYCILSQLAIPVALMAIGGSALVTTSLGYIGAFYINRCILRTFTVLLILVFLVHIGVGSTFYQMREGLIPLALEEIRSLIDKAESSKKSEALVIMERIQNRYKCCGGDGQKDWKDDIPLSCCVNPNYLDNNCRYPGMYVRGCASSIFRHFEASTHIWFYLTITLYVVEFFLVVAVCQFQCQLPAYVPLMIE